MRVTNRFAKGSAVYSCRCCKRRTRSTGRGDNDLVGLCADCFDLAGELNHLSDTGDFYDIPANVLAMIANVEAMGGDARCWDELKARALKHITPKETA